MSHWESCLVEGWCGDEKVSEIHSYYRCWRRVTGRAKDQNASLNFPVSWLFAPPLYFFFLSIPISSFIKEITSSSVNLHLACPSPAHIYLLASSKSVFLSFCPALNLSFQALRNLISLHLLNLFNGIFHYGSNASSPLRSPTHCSVA